MSSIRKYLEKIKDIYWEKSGEVEKKYNELKALDAEYVRVSSSRDYSAEGKEKRLLEISNKKSELKRVLDDLRKAANDAAMQIRSDVEKTFYSYYHADPDDVDLKMMELIRSGVLTDDELIHYGKRANPTMRRLIGKELSERKTPEAHAAGMTFLQTEGDPHLNAVDYLMQVGDYAVGGARLGGLDSVTGVRMRFDSLVDPIIDGAKDISSEIYADGSQHYSVKD